MKEKRIKGLNEIAKKKESTPSEKLVKQIIEQYNPKSVADIQNALRDIFVPMFKAWFKVRRTAILAAKATITEQKQLQIG